jgi:hypothetical protein
VQAQLFCVYSNLALTAVFRFFFAKSDLHLFRIFLHFLKLCLHFFRIFFMAAVRILGRIFFTFFLHFFYIFFTFFLHFRRLRELPKMSKSVKKCNRKCKINALVLTGELCAASPTAAVCTGGLPAAPQLAPFLSWQGRSHRELPSVSLGGAHRAPSWLPCSSFYKTGET